MSLLCLLLVELRNRPNVLPLYPRGTQPHHVLEDLARRLEEAILQCYPALPLAFDAPGLLALESRAGEWSPYISDLATALAWMDVLGDPLGLTHGISFMLPTENLASRLRRKHQVAFGSRRSLLIPVFMGTLWGMHRQVMGAELATTLKQVAYLQGMGIMLEDGTIRRCHPADVPEWLRWTAT